MVRTFFLGILVSVLVTFSVLVSAQEPANVIADISVTSKESQHGQQLGIFSKSILVDHQSKQAAAPLQRAFDRDLRMTVDNTADFWIFDAFVSFNLDLDRDGYFSTITLEFDVDTIYTQAEVYARLYLARGDVFEEYHTTSLFLIEGDSSEDQFIVESELLTGFPSDDYELLIEVYDGLNDQLVASFDGFDDADLALLPLESLSYENEYRDVVIVTETGGSFGFLILMLIPILLARAYCTSTTRTRLRPVPLAL